MAPPVSTSGRLDAGRRRSIYPSSGSRAGALDPRLQLDLVPVRVTEVEGRPVAVGAIALDDTPLERDALLGECPSDVLEVLAADREADVVESSRGLPGAGGQEVDEVVAEAELDERQFLVHAIESAAEDLFVEAPGARLVAHPDHHVVEPERRERHAPQCSARRAARRDHHVGPRRVTRPRGSLPSVDPPVLVPGEHDPLHEVAGVLVGGQLPPPPPNLPAPRASPPPPPPPPPPVGGGRPPRGA